MWRMCGMENATTQCGKNKNNNDHWGNWSNAKNDINQEQGQQSKRSKIRKSHREKRRDRSLKLLGQCSTMHICKSIATGDHKENQRHLLPPLENELCMRHVVSIDNVCLLSCTFKTHSDARANKWETLSNQTDAGVAYKVHL